MHVRSLWILALLACACAPVPDGTISSFPDPSELPAREALPALLTSHDGQTPVRTAKDFSTWRRAELLALFDHYQYGRRPDSVSVTSERTASLMGVVDGGVWEEHTLTFAGDAQAQLFVTVVRPLGVEKPKVLLALNKCGNQSLIADARVRMTTGFQLSPCGSSKEASRGVQSAEWPVAQLLARGMALVTFHESDAAPDDPTQFSSRFRSRFRAPGAANEAWGTIAVWAWSLAHVATWLEQSGEFNNDSITVFGHSRRGKAALLAGAINPAIDFGLIHQSGTAGTALHRSLEGESILLINEAFPHWFDDVFPQFAEKELTTPVDQHELIALWAPRRLVLSDGEDDLHADPQGSKAAAIAASPAWKLFDKQGFDAELKWVTRPGGHAVESTDIMRLVGVLEP